MKISPFKVEEWMNAYETGAGFGTPTNRLTFITAQREIDLPMLSKDEAAGRLLDELFSPERACARMCRRSTLSRWR